ncbi:MAG: COX15/CtaA family protein [Haloplanus sp.]
MSRSRLRSALTFPRLAAFTTALTLTLVMLGIYTAATGSGLACSAQWPLCDGGVLPQTIPSFVEWFHRLVAMITGWFIVGTAVWSWRRDGRTHTAAVLAALLLPLQISIGAVTVTLNGVLPAGYSPPTQGAHLVVALTIFTLLVWTTLSAFADRYVDPPRIRVQRATVVGVVALVVAFLLSRVFTPLPYTPAAQAAFYGTSLSLFAALLASARWLGNASLRVAPVVALAAVFGAMLLGRDLVFYTPEIRLLHGALFVVAGACLLGTAYATRRDAAGDSPGTAFGD